VYIYLEGADAERSREHDTTEGWFLSSSLYPLPSIFCGCLLFLEL
jgi:hypothetical protein